MSCLALPRGRPKPSPLPVRSTSRSEGQAAMPSNSGLAARVIATSLRTFVGPGGSVYILAAWSGRPYTPKIGPSPRNAGASDPSVRRGRAPAGRQDQGDVVVGPHADAVRGEELLEGGRESGDLPEAGRPVQRLEHPMEEGLVDGLAGVVEGKRLQAVRHDR